MTQISRPIFSRGIVLWAIALTMACLALIAFGSPIFRVLSFEYSALSALMLSLAVGFMTASSGAKRGLSRQIALQTLSLWLIPILLSTISLLVVSNCAYSDGVIFYLQIALPATVLAAAFGTAIGRIMNSHRAATWVFAAFWLVTFVVSLLPGYFFPQLFTYGWQYGYFPGLVWDEYIELGAGYTWHLAEWGSLATILLLVSRRPLLRSSWYSIAALSLIYMGLLASRTENRVVSSHAIVEEELSLVLRAGNAIIHFNGASLSHDEQSLLKANVEWYLFDTRTRLELKDTTPVSIYLYPSVETLYRYVGTRSASIAKPWRSELHIAKENLHSLRHELVHVLVREWGSFPFNASWSTAMTEGIAMALEPSYDGMHTLDEHASAIMRMKLGDGVQRVMSFAGFASGASTTSYVLAGSFTQYLLKHYPVAKFAKVYTSLDFDQAYGKPLSELERDWKTEILPLSAKMDLYDSLRTEFYFERSSIIFQPCLRRLGKLSREAQLAMKSHRYEEAEQLYREIHDESRSIGSYRGILNSILRRGAVDSARRFMYQHQMNAHPQRLSLYLLTGDFVDEPAYDTLMSAELSSGSVLTAYAHKYLPDRDSYLRQLYASNSPLSAIPLDMSETDYTGLHSYSYVADYLTAKAYEEEGMHTNAMFYFDRCLKVVNADSTAESIRWPLTLEVMSLDPFYQPRDLPTRPAWIAEFEDKKRMLAFFEQMSTDTHPPMK